MTSTSHKPTGPVVPRPSASILLISPCNHILLLRRVQTSSSFPSAHVFPGGNLSLKQDGPNIPEIDDVLRHQDGEAYRIGAIRECFEECGIILAKDYSTGRLLEIDDSTREQARRKVHNNELIFTEWIRECGARLDMENLIPFTRWITPINIPKRFTTQMYLYFLPISENASGASTLEKKETLILMPTTDGGVEHTAARFLSATRWLELARSEKIVLYPPQFFLIYLVERFLSPTPSTSDTAELQHQRRRLLEFVESGTPPWTQRCISPIKIQRSEDGRTVMGLDKPGEELKNTGRSGDSERVVLVDFQKGVPKRVEVSTRQNALGRGRKKGSL